MRDIDQLLEAKKTLEADIAGWKAKEAAHPDQPVHTDTIKAWREALSYVNDQIKVKVGDSD